MVFDLADKKYKKAKKFFDSKIYFFKMVNMGELFDSSITKILKENNGRY